MPVVSDYTAILDINDDSSARWNATTDLAVPVIVTYSFADGDNIPTVDESFYTATSTSAFTETQRQNFRDVTEIFHAAAGLIFVEVEEGGMVDISNAHGTPWSGWANYPHSSSSYTSSGILMVDDSGNYDSGSDAFSIMMHELGHATGLEHPHDGATILEASLDNQANTVMSYNWSWPNVTNLGVFDIQALQYLYGDTIDTSGWSLVYDELAQILNVVGDSANNTIFGVRGNNRLDGGAGDDVLLGREDDDILIGGAGSDILLGGRGDDTIVLSGTFSNYSFTFEVLDELAIYVTDLATNAVDTISGIEHLQFSDVTYTFNDVFAYADLAFRNVASFSAPDLTQGIDARATIYIENYNGTVDAEDVVVYAYLSLDDTLDASDVQVGSTTVSSVTKGVWSVYANITLNAPDTLAVGDYTLIYSIDPLDAFLEWDETNNIAVVADTVTVDAPRADLNFNYLSSFGSPDLTQGETTTATIYVGNSNGTADATDVTVYAYLSLDGTLDGADIQVGSYTYDSIVAGVYGDYANMSLTTPDTLAEGDYTLIYSVDPLDVIDERDETNNIAVVADTVTVEAPRADLRISAWGGVSSLTQDVARNMYVAIANNGSADASSVTVHAYLSVNDALDGADVLVGSYTYDSIVAGGYSVGANISVTAPATLAAGDYRLIYSVDPLGTIDESNETNNIAMTGSVVTVNARVNSIPTGSVAVAGTATGGEALTADTSALGDADGLGAFNYQWLRDGLVIAGATGATYDLVQADVNAGISVQVSYTDGYGTTESVTSPVVVISDPFLGTSGNDTINGDSSPNTIKGLDGDDLLLGRDGDDLLAGNAGNDRFYGGGGADRLYGGAGDDLMNGGSGNDQISGGLDNDRLSGDGGDDVMNGGAGDDWLSGGDGADRVEGGRGNDTLRGDDGNDLLLGRSGMDVLSGGAGDDRFYGGSSADRLYGGIGDDQLNGGSGDDLISGGLDNDQLFGNSGDDVMNGDSGDDWLSGGDGLDRVEGGRGNDTLRGDAGNDLLLGRSGVDVLAGGDGDDRFYGGSSADKLYGGAGDDDMNGGSGDDFMRGGLDDDTLHGNNGDDDMNGEAGNDWLSGGDGADRIEGGRGNDTLRGDAGNDLLLGRSGIDVLSGGDGDDRFYGGSSADRLFGGNGDDQLNGGSGDDLLYGGAGSDSLTGNSGADTFVFKEMAGTDTVLDFEDGADLIQYRGGSFADLTIVAAGANVDITATGGGHFVLLDMDVSLISVDDFVF